MSLDLKDFFLATPMAVFEVLGKIFAVNSHAFRSSHWYCKKKMRAVCQRRDEMPCFNFQPVQ